MGSGRGRKWGRQRAQGPGASVPSLDSRLSRQGTGNRRAGG